MKRDLKKFEFVLTKDALVSFVEKIDDLSIIDNYIVIKIDKENILLYSVATDPEDKNKKIILAFKSFSFKTDEIITFTKNSELDEQIIYILKDAKKTIRNLKMFFEYDDIINCSLTYDKLNDLYFCDNFNLKNKKIKQNFGGGTPMDSNFRINLQSIKDKSTADLMELKFNISKNDFTQAKKMSLIETENDVIYFFLRGKELSVAENRWALTIDDNFTYDRKKSELENEIDIDTDVNVCIPKKYFRTATCEDSGLDIEIYRSHILINNDKSNLMIARQMSLA